MAFVPLSGSVAAFAPFTLVLRHSSENEFSAISVVTYRKPPSPVISKHLPTKAHSLSASARIGQVPSGPNYGQESGCTHRRSDHDARM